MITEGKLLQLDQKYVELALSARTDKTYASDYNAAFHAPAAFLRNPSDLEATFDKIIFHLDSAFKKAGNEDIKDIISRTAEELFSEHIYVIQARIKYIKNQNAKGFFQKMFDTAKGITSKLPDLLSRNIKEIAVNLSEDAINLVEAYFTFLTTKWKINEEESFFYNQLANVYEKILDSSCFNNEFGLLRNTFSRNKENIIHFVVLHKGLTSALNLTKFDKTVTELQDSTRIIVKTLMNSHNWEKLIDFMKLVKSRNLANYIELKREVIEKYKKTNLPKGTVIAWGGMGTLVGLFTFFGVIYYKFKTAKNVTGFFDAIWHFITTSFDALFIALGAAIGVVVIIYLIVKIIAAIKDAINMKAYKKSVGVFENLL
jgi:hypothetical protein